jgi:hypothetical protein
VRLLGKKGAWSPETIYILRRNERQNDFSLALFAAVVIYAVKL